MNFPEVHKLFEGSFEDKRQLLRTFLSSGENLKRCEVRLQFEKTVECEQEGVEELLTVSGMVKAGVHEHLGIFIHCFLLLLFRFWSYVIVFESSERVNFFLCLDSEEKIEAILASQQPILDPQHPEVLEEARYSRSALGVTLPA